MPTSTARPVSPLPSTRPPIHIMPMASDVTRGAGMSKPLLQVDAIRKSYGSLEALQGVSFEVAEGECFGLLGPNGAGKTTLISVLSCLLAQPGAARNWQASRSARIGPSCACKSASYRKTWPSTAS